LLAWIGIDFIELLDIYACSKVHGV
jgi:hypothetical protein